MPFPTLPRPLTGLAPALAAAAAVAWAIGGQLVGSPNRLTSSSVEGVIHAAPSAGPAAAAELQAAVTALQDTEAELPYVEGAFIYYNRKTDAGDRVWLRRRIGAGQPEQLLLDSAAFTPRGAVLGAFAISPNANLLAYSTATTADRYTLRIKDLASHRETLPVDNTDFSVAWSPAGDAVFYAPLDGDGRPHGVGVLLPPAASGPAHPVAAAARTVLRAPARADVLVAATPRGPTAFVTATGTPDILAYRLAPLADFETPVEVHLGTDPLPGAALEHEVRAPAAVK